MIDPEMRVALLVAAPPLWWIVWFRPQWPEQWGYEIERWILRKFL